MFPPDRPDSQDDKPSNEGKAWTGDKADALTDGPAGDPAGDDIDAAKALLNRMRQASLARGNVPQRAPGRSKSDRNRQRGSGQGGEATAGRDPQMLGNVFSRLVNERGWNSPVAVGSVIARWAELVGPDIAAHCTPESFTDTVVQVRTDSTAWATQLRLLSPSLLARFDTQLGNGVVTKIQVLGPAAPNWKKGRRSVKGRGPRDTYG